MKALFFLLLLYFQQLYGQTIELKGRFGASFIGGESIDFVGKDSFYFEGFYCTYGVHGKGRCEIRSNFLYLYFENNPDKPRTDTLRSDIITKSSAVDSVSEIQLTIVNNQDIPVPYASIIIENSISGKFGTITDASGRAVFNINNNSSPFILTTSAVGIDTRHLKLEGGSNYDIKLFHHQIEQDNKVLNKGEVYVYEIEDLSEELILMRPERSSEPFRKYRKKSD